MAWNGSGTFTRTNGVNSGTEVWEQDADDGTKITSAHHDAHDQDLADGLNNCLTLDGQNKMLANFDVNGFDIRNVATITGSPTFTGYANFNLGVVVSQDLTVGSGGGTTSVFNALTVYGSPTNITSAEFYVNNIDISGNFEFTGTSFDMGGKNITNTPPTTKQAISGTGVQSFDLNSGWLVDDTISGSQDINFTNGTEGANGIIKLINTNGNTLDLSGTGLTFKRSIQGVLYPYAQITLESGATTEQIITYHFQSATEVIYTVK